MGGTCSAAALDTSCLPKWITSSAKTPMVKFRVKEGEWQRIVRETPTSLLIGLRSTAERRGFPFPGHQARYNDRRRPVDSVPKHRQAGFIILHISLIPARFLYESEEQPRQPGFPQKSARRLSPSIATDAHRNEYTRQQFRILAGPWELDRCRWTLDNSYPNQK